MGVSDGRTPASRHFVQSRFAPITHLASAGTRLPRGMLECLAGPSRPAMGWGMSIVDRIHSRAAVVGVIGQGYVGLPLALVFEEAGFTVRGFDVDQKKVDALTRGESYIKHIGADRVAASVRRGRFTVSTDFDGIRECDAVLICVPTPLGRHRE